MLHALAALLTCSILAAAAPASPEECGDCTLDTGKVSLCREHDKAESAALRRLKKLARSKDPEQRMEALLGLAGISSEHENAPSQEAAELIVAYLEEDLASARTAAVAALLDGQHPEVVVAALSAEVDGIARDWKAADAYLRSWAQGKEEGSLSSNPKKRAEFFTHARVLQYGPDVLQALGKLPDERSAEALVAVLHMPVESTPAVFLRTAAESALALRTREGIEAVVDLLERLDAWLADAPPAEGYDWARNTQTVNDALVRALALRMQREDFDAVREQLRTTLQAMGLSDPPDVRRGASAQWKAWLDANAASFPSEPGRLTTPVKAKLERKRK